MATSLVRQTKFTTGEIDVQNYNRTEFQDYLTAAQSLLNCEVGTTGLAKKRKGTKFLHEVSSYANESSLLFEFSDKNGNFYILMVSNLVTYIFLINTDGSLTLYGNVATPYPSAQISALDWTTDNDSIIFTHPAYAPRRIYVSSYGPAVFTLETINIYPFPAFDFGTVAYNNFDVTLSAIVNNIMTFTFTGTGGSVGFATDPGFTTAWVGGQIVGGGESPESPLGYGVIQTVTPWAAPGDSVIFTVLVRIPFETDALKYSKLGSQYSVKQPSFSDTLGWPAKTIFYQNRLWFANTKTLNNTLFGSKINNPINFDVGTGEDTDAIIYTIGLADSGPVVWLNGGKQLEIYTSKYEFAAPQEQNIGLTPSTFSIRQQSAYGSSDKVKPVTYINDSYYVSISGNAILNYHFDGIGQTYTSTNISLHSSHLVKNPITSAIIRGTSTSQDNFIYFLNPDSTITTFQFSLENKLAALTPIDFNKNILNGVTPGNDTNTNSISVLDIVAINNEIYILKNYTKTGRFALEKMVNDVKLDSYSDYTMAANGLITGLIYFERYYLQVIIDGQDFGQYQVINGQIQVDTPFNLIKTVQLGILYPVQIRTMYLFAGEQQYVYFKNVSRIFVDYYQSLNFTVNGTPVNYQTFYNIQHNIPISGQTGTAIINPVSGWSRFDTILIEQNAPFDLQIIAVGYQINAAII